MSWNTDLFGPHLGIAASNALRIRVMAGPGTGKSFAMKRRIARLIEEDGVQPDRILAVTFTRTAARDLERELQNLEVPGCEDIDAGTVHSFCFSLLLRNDVFEFLGRVPRGLISFNNKGVYGFEIEPLLADLQPLGAFGARREMTKRIRAFEADWARMQHDQPGWPIDPVDQQFHNMLTAWLQFHQGMLIQEIIVNSQVRVQEAWTVDNWNGGTYGHALYLAIPEPLFLRSVKTRADTQKRIGTDINKLHNFQNESIDEVFLEMEAKEHRNWRKDSGVLLTGKRVVLPDATKRIWGDLGYRVFLTHKSKVKSETSKLKESLRSFGISAFVAHKDIRPTKEWRDEIENALTTMDALVALMTDGFHESDWTDQEIGYAFGRGVPIIAVRLGVDPYGFIGKFQALSCEWKDAPLEIVKLFVGHDRMLNFYIQAVQDCTGWIEGCSLAQVLPAIETLSDKQADLLIEAYNESDEVRGSWGFNGTRPAKYGEGLLFHLKRLNERSYKETSSGKIKVVS